MDEQIPMTTHLLVQTLPFPWGGGNEWKLLIPRHSSNCFSICLQQPLHLNPKRSLLTPEHWVQIYSNQKEIKHISPSNIRADVETALPSYIIYSISLPPSHPWHFKGLPPSLARFCNSRISSTSNKQRLSSGGNTHQRSKRCGSNAVLCVSFKW